MAGVRYWIIGKKLGGTDGTPRGQSQDAPGALVWERADQRHAVRASGAKSEGRARPHALATSRGVFG